MSITRLFLTALALISLLSGCTPPPVAYPPYTEPVLTKPAEMTPITQLLIDESEIDIEPVSEPETDISSEPPVHNHDYTLITVVNATCTEKGTQQYQCSCGDIQTHYIDVLGHEYREIARKDAGYVLTGTVTYRCRRCSAQYSDTLPTLTCQADIDMCGPSLIEKVLPHAPHPEKMQQVFDLYHTHPQKYHGNQLSEEGFVELSDDFTVADATETLVHTYRYFCFAVPPYFTYHEDRDILWVFYDEQQGDKQAAIYQRAEQILQELGIDETVTQKDAILRINEYLCERNYYEHDADKRASTLYEAMFNAGNICETYALAFQVLCLTAGIECHYYSSVEMHHAWNKVYFSDGSYLWVDVTWNDARILVSGQPTEAKRGTHDDTLITEMRSRFLLIDDAQLAKTHSA